MINEYNISNAKIMNFMSPGKKKELEKFYDSMEREFYQAWGDTSLST